jgi:acetyl-CoA acyltransferase
MASALIVDALRTPGGKRNGSLAGWHPVDLAAETLAELVRRNDLDPAAVDDVIMGCVMQVGRQSLNVGRSAVLGAGWPESVPGTTIDRQCGSSQQALHFAAQGVIAGAYDLVVAAGVEVMSTTPLGASVTPGSMPYGTRAIARYADRQTYDQVGLVGQGISAELVADTWRLSRDDLDEYGVRSQERAIRATEEGRFAREVHPVRVCRLDGATGQPVNADEIITHDEGLRKSTMEALAGLRPAFLPGGKVTAGNSSQITDGASALLVASEEAARRHGLRPRARVRAFAVIGSDPILMLTGPIAATRKVLAQAGLRVEDIDLFEVNEAFASVVLAWLAETGADLDRVNVNGGAIALGHPLGASGGRLVTTLLHELERTNGRYGLVTMCEGGGMANATIIERL